ncbi:MAG: hypothetical protein R2827_14005 [Bdellovibrionales bacterium]
MRTLLFLVAMNLFSYAFAQSSFVGGCNIQFELEDPSSQAYRETLEQLQGYWISEEEQLALESNQGSRGTGVAFNMDFENQTAGLVSINFTDKSYEKWVKGNKQDFAWIVFADYELQERQDRSNAFTNMYVSSKDYVFKAGSQASRAKIIEFEYEDGSCESYAVRLWNPRWARLSKLENLNSDKTSVEQATQNNDIDGPFESRKKLVKRP